MKKFRWMRLGLRAVGRRFWPRSIMGRILVMFGSGTLAAFILLVTLFALIVGSHVAGALWGAVNIFNSPTVAPSEAEMVGTYHLHPKGARSIKSLSFITMKPSFLELRPNRTAVLQNVYEYVDSSSRSEQFSLCKISGMGFWHVDTFTGIQVSIQLQQGFIVDGPSPCASEKWVSYAILGRGTVHKLWSYIGDPDSDTGFEYYR